MARLSKREKYLCCATFIVFLISIALGLLVFLYLPKIHKEQRERLREGKEERICVCTEDDQKTKRSGQRIIIGDHDNAELIYSKMRHLTPTTKKMKVEEKVDKKVEIQKCSPNVKYLTVAKEKYHNINEYSYIVSIIHTSEAFGDHFLCTGSVISKNKVLTAANCLAHRFDSGDVIVKYLSNIWKLEGKDQNIRYTKKVDLERDVYKGVLILRTRNKFPFSHVFKAVEVIMKTKQPNFMYGLCPGFDRPMEPFAYQTNSTTLSVQKWGLDRCKMDTTGTRMIRSRWEDNVEEKIKIKKEIKYDRKSTIFSCKRGYIVLKDIDCVTMGTGRPLVATCNLVNAVHIGSCQQSDVEYFVSLQSEEMQRWLCKALNRPCSEMVDFEVKPKRTIYRDVHEIWFDDVMCHG